MYIATDIVENLQVNYPLEKLGKPEDILFLDIETTGFTAKSSYLYLIGCAYFEDGHFYTKQWLAESYDQEKNILCAFFEFASRFHTLIHFNGNNFDLPYILQKCAQHGLDYNFEQFTGIDLYKRISPYKFFMKLPNCKQKTLEQYIGLQREDPFTGGELIDTYHDYVKHNNAYHRGALLLHNCEDLTGMLSILPVLAYYDIFNDDTKAKKVQANYYTDYNGNRRQELLITLTLPSPLPVPLSVSVNTCYFKGEDSVATLRIPLFDEELKYFYSNYSDYYYLPTEDVALHKSVAQFVDKEHRIQATAATCYTRKQSLYLRQWELLFTPFFKRDYKSKELFFELTDEMKRDRPAFTAYAKHVLDMMSTTY